MWSLPDERIELLGASGRAYSFHLADPALAEGRAGQYAICADDGSVAVLGETEDLACGAQMLQSVRSSCPNARLYLRLNVRRRTRMEELQDLTAGDALLAAAAGLASAGQDRRSHMARTDRAGLAGS